MSDLSNAEVVFHNKNSENVASGHTDMETKDTLSEGLIGLLGPSVEQVDERVRSVRQSQLELRSKIDSLAEDLKLIQDEQPVPVELETYVKKLNNSRRRVMLVNNILQNAQERLGKLHANVSKETARRKALLEPPEPPTTSSEQTVATNAS